MKIACLDSSKRVWSFQTEPRGRAYRVQQVRLMPRSTPTGTRRTDWAAEMTVRGGWTPTVGPPGRVGAGPVWPVKEPSLHLCRRRRYPLWQLLRAVRHATYLCSHEKGVVCSGSCRKFRSRINRWHQACDSRAIFNFSRFATPLPHPLVASGGRHLPSSRPTAVPPTSRGSVRPPTVSPCPGRVSPNRRANRLGPGTK